MSLELTRRLAASQLWLDGVADAVQPTVRRLLGRAPRLRNLLDGRWLGAPLHPALTDVPLGAWTTAAILDCTRRDSKAADAALALGLAAAVPTAVTGTSDFAHLRGEQRRIASLHGLLNGGALVLNVASLALRWGGHRGAGRALSLAAYGAVALSAHLGGQLAFGLGVRVNRTAWQAGPDDFVAVLRESELGDDGLHRVDVSGAPVLLARSVEGGICAIAAICSHLGGPLDEGERNGDVVTCPWHGSRFDLCDGSVVAAPAVFPQPRYEVRVRSGTIEVRRQSPSARSAAIRPSTRAVARPLE